MLHQLIQAFHVGRIVRRRPHAPDGPAGNAVGEALGMPHVFGRVGQVVVQQLRGLCLLQRQVILHDNRLHEVLVDHFAVSLPDLAVVRDEDVIAAGDEVV